VLAPPRQITHACPRRSHDFSRGQFDISTSQQNRDVSDPDQLVNRRVLDRYRFLTCLGEGAMGVVYLGHDELDDQHVAIKTLSENALEMYANQRSRLIERFRREIAMTRKLQHPNIVRLLADGELEEGLPFVVLEYLEGWDLRDILDDEKQIKPARAARIGLGIALALAESHSHGVVHRDLKPENVFLVQRPGADEQVKVLDFGIARGTDDEEERLTVAGTALGTPRYMAPEQVKDDTLTPACDIYTFGVLLYEMLSGDVPYWDDNQLTLALMHVNSTPPPLDVEGMEVELLESFRALILELMEKEPRKRPKAEDVANKLARLHTMALNKEEVDPDKDTQILRVDVQQLRTQGLSDTPRPTRVMGVRTTMGWGVPSAEQLQASPDNPSLSDSRAATALVTTSPSQRAETAALGSRTSLNHAATEILDTSGAAALLNKQKAATDKVKDRQKAPTAKVDGRQEAQTVSVAPIDPSLMKTMSDGPRVGTDVITLIPDDAPPKKSKLGLWLAVLVVLAAAGVGLYFALS